MTRCLVLLSLIACACPNKQTVPPGGGSGGATGSGPGTTTVPAGTKCDEMRPHIEQLYRAEAQAKEPKRVDDAVADNTTMVLNDCEKDPDRFVSCIAAAKSVAELEKQCLVPIDDEGTEGERK